MVAKGKAMVRDPMQLRAYVVTSADDNCDRYRANTSGAQPSKSASPVAGACWLIHRRGLTECK